MSPADDPRAGPGATRAGAVALLRAARGEGPPAGPHLVVCEPGVPWRPVSLGEETLLGRGRGAALRLADGGASRRHALVRLDPAGGATVEDLASKNGVELNGRRLGPGPADLAPGDRLRIGETELRYVDPLAEGADEGERIGLRRPVPAWTWLAAAAAALAVAATLLAVLS